MTLKFGPHIEVPDEIVTGTNAMLALRGTGKSNAAVVMAEEMNDAGYQWVAIDPKGDWWGIRSNAKGTGPGLSVPVFGGRHGDLPLEATAGTLMAALIIERDLTCVLDVSLFSKGEQIKFVTDFAESLWRNIGDRPRPMHLFLEEAEEFLPQKVDNRAARMVGAYSKISKQGRTLGLGVTLITQRSASLNKDALSQTDTLILFRTTSPHDRKAVVAWADFQPEAKAVAESLSSLQPGESWILSPGFLQSNQRAKWRRRRTFDSGATPKVGVVRRDPVRLADIDLAEIKELMAETVEKAEKNDPTVLRKRIVALERERDALAAKANEATVERVVETVEVPVVPETAITLLESIDSALRALAEGVQANADGIEPVLARIRWHMASAPQAQPPEPRRAQPATPDRPAALTTPSSGLAGRPPDGNGLGKAERLVLTVLAQHPEGRDRIQLAILTGYSAKASTIPNALGSLRSAGYVTTSGTPQITDTGRDALGEFEELPRGTALLDWWHAKLGKAEWLVLQELTNVYPGELVKGELCDRTGYSVTASTVPNALGKLRSLRLVIGNRASADLMDEVLA